MGGRQDVTVYTLADGGYAPGVVAMHNSLRLQGHDLPLVVLDGGLSEEQRSLLDGRATFEPLPAEVSERGYLAKSFMSTLDVSGIVLWIDADIIVTSSLDEPLSLAREGRFCAFRDDFPEDYARRFPEWEQVFGLESEPREQTYVSSGFFAFSADRWPWLIERWSQATQRVPFGSMFTGNHRTNPTWAADQDALNAVLMSELPAGVVAAYPTAEMAHTRTLGDAEVLDEQRLEVRHQGQRARVVHYSWGPKPWMAADLRRVAPNAYVRLFRRVVFGHDVDLRLPERAVPLWLRPSRAGRGVLRGIVAARHVRSGIGGVVKRLPAPLRRPFERTRDRVDRWIKSR
jgi:Glycosyl transferase family 8